MSECAAARMAIDAVNNNTDFLRDFELKLNVFDGRCEADMVMKSFIDFVRNDKYPRMVGILGPACSDTVEPIAGVSKHYNTIVISYSAQGSSYSDRDKFPNFFRTIAESHQYKYVRPDRYPPVVGWFLLTAGLVMAGHAAS